MSSTTLSRSAKDPKMIGSMTLKAVGIALLFVAIVMLVIGTIFYEYYRYNRESTPMWVIIVIVIGMIFLFIGGIITVMGSALAISGRDAKTENKKSYSQKIKEAVVDKPVEAVKNGLQTTRQNMSGMQFPHNISGGINAQMSLMTS